MDTKEKIEALEAEKLECAKVMRESDEHLIGCQKKGEVFAEEYPKEYNRYIAANKRYNAIEGELAPLYEQLEKEREQEAQRREDEQIH